MGAEMNLSFCTRHNLFNAMGDLVCGKCAEDMRAERDTLKAECEKLRAIPHSCYENCTVPDCVNARLRTQLAEAIAVIQDYADGPMYPGVACQRDFCSENARAFLAKAKQ